MTTAAAPTIIPALEYDQEGIPVAADQELYAKARLAGAQVFGNGVLDQAAPLGAFDPNSFMGAGVKPENLTADTLAALAGYGLSPDGGGWQYASDENPYSSAYLDPATGKRGAVRFATPPAPAPESPAPAPTPEAAAPAPTPAPAAASSEAPAPSPEPPAIQADPSSTASSSSAPAPALALTSSEHEASKSLGAIITAEEHKLSELARDAWLKLRALLAHL